MKGATPRQVGLVARCLNTEHVRGMGKYVYELLRQSQADGAPRWKLFADDPRYPVLTPGGPQFEIDLFSFRGDRFRLWEQVGLPRRVRTQHLDLLHCTEGCLPLWQPVPTIVTLHDTLAFAERPDEPFARLYWDRLIPAALRRCAHVITISESSRRDILARWPELERKLSVILHGIDEEYFGDDRTPLPAELTAALNGQPYLVYLGGPMQRKRFDWAVKLLHEHPRKDFKLLACGFGSAARQQTAQALPAAVRDRVCFAPFLSDDELRAAYRGACAVLYPTLYEGFGFPAIEAQASGVPVIFSPLGSLQELVGPLAMVVDAHDMAAWVDAVTRAAAQGPEEREVRAGEARRWARQFQWSRSFEKHAEVYERVAARSR